MSPRPRPVRALRHRNERWMSRVGAQRLHRGLDRSLRLLLLCLWCGRSSDGWSMPAREVPFGLRPALASAPCSIDRQPGLTWEMLRADYIWRERPVIFGTPWSGRRWAGEEEALALGACRTALSQRRVRGEFTDAPVLVHDLSGLAQVGPRISTLGVALDNFARGVHNYSADGGAVGQLFDQELAGLPGLLDGCGPLPSIERVAPPDAAGSRGATQVQEVGVGATGTGIPWHWHQAVFANTLVFGVKRWFVWTDTTRLPPGGANPGQTPAQWLRDVHPTISPSDRAFLQECNIQAGESVFVPEGMYHQTLNIRATVFMTTVLQGGQARKTWERTVGRRGKMAAAETCSRGAGGWVQELSANCARASTLFPHEPEFRAHHGLALWLQSPPDREAALEQFRAAAELSNSSQVYSYLAAVSLDVGSDAEALEAARRAMQLSGIDMRACNLAGQALQALGRAAEAQQMLEECVSRSDRVLSLPEASGSLVYRAHFERTAARFAMEYTASTTSTRARSVGDDGVAVVDDGQTEVQLRSWLSRPVEGSPTTPRGTLFRSLLAKPSRRSTVAMFDVQLLGAVEQQVRERHRELLLDWAAGRGFVPDGGPAAHDTERPAYRLAEELVPAHRKKGRWDWVWERYPACVDVLEGGCRACLAISCGWCEDGAHCVPDQPAACRSGDDPFSRTSARHLGTSISSACST
ncbi:unnamed protein product [Prorocentrum cordatum]|uniref:JmjC domain-containing protein n=2 Tax=Prorocentrum cordatum TaxID=2364126 RepID=A0ABN9R2X3_9DINO|nr:unnamed protein product [Polarella glacialis]